jgi:hypothetical protein
MLLFFMWMEEIAFFRSLLLHIVRTCRLPSQTPLLFNWEKASDHLYDKVYTSCTNLNWAFKGFDISWLSKFNIFNLVFLIELFYDRVLNYFSFTAESPYVSSCEFYLLDIFR